MEQAGDDKTTICRFGGVVRDIAPEGDGRGTTLEVGGEVFRSGITLSRFDAYQNEKHQCGHCTAKAYFYCSHCFPDPSSVPYATCATRLLAANALPSMYWV